MKIISLRQILLLPFILFVLSTRAQLVTISESHQLPFIGDTVHYLNANPFGFDSSGTGTVNNKIWDESGLLNTGTSYDFYYSDPALVAPGFGRDSFPDATIVRAESGASGYFFYKNTLNDINRLGWYGSTTSYGIYTDSTFATEFHFPITAGQTISSSYKGRYAPLNAGEDSMKIESGQITINADMQGQLILPTGAFDNVLRLHVTESFHITAYFSGLPIVDDPVVDDYYYWFVDTILQPILVFGKTYENGSVQSSVLRYQPLSPSLNNIPSVNENIIKVFPNPSSGNYFIDHTNESIKEAQIEIFNAYGEKMSFTRIAGFSIDEIILSEARKGIYVMKIFKTNQTLTSIFLCNY